MKISDKLWDQMLALKEALNCTDTWQDISYDQESGFVLGNTNGIEDVKIHRNKNNENYKVTISMCSEQAYLSYNRLESLPAVEIMRMYLPLLIFNKLDSDRVTVLCHVAQSLDGMMSTVGGHSKWIGNEQNLIHAHRLRALVDGVVVGGKTITLDLPRLDVRHVKGNNPKRILLSNTFSEIDALPTIEAETILLRRAGNKLSAASKYSCNVLEYQESCPEGTIGNILSQLKEQNINSIMVEGGAQTISSFFKAGVVDLLQVHIAPIVFGSGRRTFSLPEIMNVNEGWKMESVMYTQMGDAMMMTAQPSKRKEI